MKFKCSKKLFTIKEFSVRSAKTIDTIHFLPPIPFNTLSNEEKKAVNWFSRILHGLRWDKGEYRFSNMDQICDSIRLRNPNAKGTQKSDF